MINSIIIISIIIVIVVLVLSVATTSKAYKFKHTIDPLEHNPHIQNDKKEEKNNPHD